MQKLLTPEFRQSLLGEKPSEGEGKAQLSLSQSHQEGVAVLLTAQWAIITRTLARALGQTDLYEIVMQELTRALHQNPDSANGKTAHEEDEFPLPGLVYCSPLMRELARQIYKIRDSRLPALVTGEPGTGKEGIARALHFLSDRCAGPFVAFN